MAFSKKGNAFDFAATVESMAKNECKQEAYSLANSALQVPESVPLFASTSDATACQNLHAPVTNMCKVATDLEETSPERPKA
jgi:hypothetical protein